MPKLWDKGFSTAQEIERFTVGRDREMDLYLAPYTHPRLPTRR